jgi:DNA polymerase-1
VRHAAWFPQVSEIDVTKETPVGHGRITCFSVYCGPEMDFGDGKKRLWVDVLKGGREVLHAFKPYLESDTILKVRRCFWQRSAQS